MRKHKYPVSQTLQIIEDIENHLRFSDNEWIIERLVDDLLFEEKFFKKYKRKLKKIRFITCALPFPAVTISR